MTQIPAQQARIYQFPRPYEFNRTSAAALQRAPVCSCSRGRVDGSSQPNELPQFRDSLALAKSISAGKPVDSSQLTAEEPITEREMFSALAHHHLANRNPSAAQALSERLPEAARQFQLQNICREPGKR